MNLHIVHHFTGKQVELSISRDVAKEHTPEPATVRNRVGTSSTQSECSSIDLLLPMLIHVLYHVH